MTFEALYAAHASNVLRQLQAAVGPDAPDLAQEVWLKVFLHLDTFRGTAKPSSWLYRIAANTAATHYRQQHAKRRVPLAALRALEEALGVIDAAPTPDAVAFAAERRAWLALRLAALAPKLQAALLASVELDSTLLGAQRLGIPHGTFKTRAHRARLRLRRRAVREGVA